MKLKIYFILYLLSYKKKKYEFLLKFSVFLIDSINMIEVIDILNHFLNCSLSF